MRSGLIVLLWAGVIYCKLTPLSGQAIDTAILMDELAVSAPTLLGTGSDTVDLSTGASQLTQLTDVLRIESNVYFRDYGPGSSSTVSMFGSKSNEVAMIWNGIQIANPMLGVNDYSMISTADLTTLRIARVGHSTIFGAGSGAGAILLDQKIKPVLRPLTLSAGWSSLQELKGNASFTDAKGSWKSRTSIQAGKAQNDFRYKTHSGTYKNLDHAAAAHTNLSHHSEFHPRKNQYWTFSAWGRKHNREIPPTLTEARSEANQSDAFLRSVIQYHFTTSKHHLNVKAYYGFQKQRYRNPLIDLNAVHRFQNGQFRVDNQWQPHPDFFIKYGVQSNYFTSRSDNYHGRKHQHRNSAYAHLQYEVPGLPIELILMAKPEKVTGQKMGWTTEGKIRYSQKTTGDWMVFANKNMVWPTLNDLHWSPGGNPDLMPEKNQIYGLSWKKSWADNLRSSSTLYYRQAKNWIQWLPGNLGFWQPMNAHQGRSYGIYLELEKAVGPHVKMRSGYQFVRSYIMDEANRKNQTVYNPEHLWSFTGISNIKKQWEWKLEGQYTSTRYVTKDHTEALDPYFLCHSSLIYTLKNRPWSFAMRITNLFDSNYEGIKNRPMPGRQIHLHTIIKL